VREIARGRGGCEGDPSSSSSLLPPLLPPSSLIPSLPLVEGGTGRGHHALHPFPCRDTSTIILRSFTGRGLPTWRRRREKEEGLNESCVESIVVVVVVVVVVVAYQRRSWEEQISSSLLPLWRQVHWRQFEH